MKQKAWEIDKSRGRGSNESAGDMRGERVVGRKDYLGFHQEVIDKVCLLRVLNHLNLGKKEAFQQKSLRKHFWKMYMVAAYNMNSYYL